MYIKAGLRRPDLSSTMDSSSVCSHHLIAGPIQRPGHLLPQVQKERTFDADRFFDGMMLIFSGLIRQVRGR